jgi:carbamate kinase
MLIVVALGGNAVSPPDHMGNIDEQFAATRRAVRPLADLIVQGHQLVITHGNGPQVGNVMLRVEIAARQNVYRLPLDIAVADTEAGMGYMIGQCLMNELADRGTPRICATIITTVRVDADDPALSDPTKPVGPFLSLERAREHARENGWIMKEEPPHGWRRVVPSPRPREIVELSLLKKLVAGGETIVAAGGGGIPVVRDAGGHYRGVEAVIDKDYTSGLLASALEADRLLILTGVDRMERNFGKPTAEPIDALTPDEAENLLAQGQFPPGSMGPKVRAAVDFVRGSPKSASDVLITSCERLAESFQGKSGTRIARRFA